MRGRLIDFFVSNKTKNVHGDESIGWELYGNRALIKGNYKLVLTWPPEGTGRWELYDIQSDPAEAEDISLDYPDLTKELINDWIIYANENGVAIFERDIGYGRYP